MSKRLSILQFTAIKTKCVYRRGMLQRQLVNLSHGRTLRLWQNNADYNLIHKYTQKDTINFVCYYYTRDVFSVISKFFIPFGQIFVCHFSCDVKYLSIQQHLVNNNYNINKSLPLCSASHVVLHTMQPTSIIWKVWKCREEHVHYYTNRTTTCTCACIIIL